MCSERARERGKQTMVSVWEAICDLGGGVSQNRERGLWEREREGERKRAIQDPNYCKHLEAKLHQPPHVLLSLWHFRLHLSQLPCLAACLSSHFPAVLQLLILLLFLLSSVCSLSLFCMHRGIKNKYGSRSHGIQLCISSMLQNELNSPSNSVSVVWR